MTMKRPSENGINRVDCVVDTVQFRGSRKLRLQESLEHSVVARVVRTQRCRKISLRSYLLSPMVAIEKRVQRAETLKNEVGESNEKKPEKMKDKQLSQK